VEPIAKPPVRGQRLFYKVTPEMSQSEQTELERRETEPPKTSGLGELLRNEREKKGLSYSQISEIIRLRPYILEALENEDWSHLPSPVFVRGFIRAYAGVLGVEQAKAVKLYQEAAPAETARPKPVEKPAKTRKKLSLSLVPLLMAVAFALYLWKGYSSHDKGLMDSDRLRVSEKPTQAEHRERPKPPNDQMEMPAPHIPDKVSEGVLSVEVFSSENAEAPPSSAPATPLESGPAPDIVTPELSLEIEVKEMTWIRVFVDDQEPREYMLRPGDHLDWRATKGFEMLIGNAGGIDLEFNGTELRNLGSHGEVVRLRLPEGYERAICRTKAE